MTTVIRTGQFTDASENQEPMVDEERLPYCIVGAGPSGLIAGRALKRAGIPFEIIEQHDAVGGIWNIEHPGSPVYESCNFIAHSRHSGFIGFPFPDSSPDYPTWRQVRDYIHAFCAEYDLSRHITLGQRVVSAEPLETEGGTCWTVSLESGVTKRYRGVVWACGQQQTPVTPPFPGLDRFEGRIIHSSDHKRGSEFSDDRVLVVGGGNSGVDIACDAAAFGRSAAWSIRRGYWFWPKLVFGQPVSAFLQGAATLPQGFPDVSAMSPNAILETLLETVGDLTRYGLPRPVGPPGSSRPIINDQALHYLAHGRLEVRPDIAEILSRGVRFVDGSEQEFDQIVFATGYKIDIPWLPPRLLRTPVGLQEFHLGTFARDVDGLYAVGLLHFAGPFYVMWDKLAQLMVAEMLDHGNDPNGRASHAIRSEPTEDVRGPSAVADPANPVQADFATLDRVIRDLSDKFGIEMPTGLRDMAFYEGVRAMAGAASG